MKVLFKMNILVEVKGVKVDLGIFLWVNLNLVKKVS